MWAKGMGFGAMGPLGGGSHGVMEALETPPPLKRGIGGREPWGHGGVGNPPPSKGPLGGGSHGVMEALETPPQKKGGGKADSPGRRGTVSGREVQRARAQRAVVE